MKKGVEDCIVRDPFTDQLHVLFLKKTSSKLCAVNKNVQGEKYRNTLYFKYGKFMETR